MLGSTPTYLPTGEDLPRKPRQSVLFLSCYHLYEKLSQSLSAHINPNLLVDGEDSPHEPRQSVSYTSLGNHGGIPSRSQPPADSCPLISTCSITNSYSSITNSSLSGLGDKRVVNPVHKYQYALVKLTVSKASVMPLCLRWYRELSRFFPVYAYC